MTAPDNPLAPAPFLWHITPVAGEAEHQHHGR